jgi:hypothetical protein
MTIKLSYHFLHTFLATGYSLLLFMNSTLAVIIRGRNNEHAHFLYMEVLSRKVPV